MNGPADRSQVHGANVTKESDMNTVAPYADAAHFYNGTGLGSPVPIKAGAKHPVLRSGCTGAKAQEMQGHEIDEEVQRNPNANVAIRMEEWMISIDVDNYGEKQGGATLAAATAELGPLPRTWRSTRRQSDRVSGQSWYRVPAGMRWASNLKAFGPDVEVIHSNHRYAIVWPSVVDDQQYRWFRPDGSLVDGQPDFFYMDFPELPEAWVARLQANAQGAEDISDDVQVEFSEWTYGATDPYVENMLEGWDKNDDEVPNWHDWLFSSCCRLTAAHRLGLVSEDDLRHGRDIVRLRLKYAKGRTSTEGADSEFTRCWNDARQKVERMTDEQAAEALGSAGRGAASAAGAEMRGRKAGTTARKPAAAPTAETESAEPQIASWLPVDLTAFIDGTHEEEHPCIMQREDGRHLLYKGRVHSFHGESESGKSWVALIAAADLLKAGERCVMLDYESDPSTVVGRLLRLGVPATALAAAFTYIRPEASPFVTTEREAWSILLQVSAALVILDGVTEALTTMETASKDNDEITEWVRNVPRAIARATGAAVVLVDHVTKDSESRGRFAIGGQAKMAALDGAAYVVEVKKPLGVGLAGQVSVRVAKDRPGQVRPFSGAWRSSDRTQETTLITIDSTEEGVTDYTMEAPSTSVGDASEAAAKTGGRPGDLMERLTQAAKRMKDLAESQGREAYFSSSEVQSQVGGKAATKRTAMAYLIEYGYLVADGPKGPGGHAKVRWVMDYSEALPEVLVPGAGS